MDYDSEIHVKGEFAKVPDKTPDEVREYWFCHVQTSVNKWDDKLEKLLLEGKIPSAKAKTPSGHWYFRIKSDYLDDLEEIGFTYTTLGWEKTLDTKSSSLVLHFARGMALDFMWESFKWLAIVETPSNLRVAGYRSRVGHQNLR